MPANLKKKIETLEKRLSALEEQKGENQKPRVGFSIKEVAIMLGRNPATVMRLIQRGKLKCNKSLRTPIISKRHLEEFLNESFSQ